MRALVTNSSIIQTVTGIHFNSNLSTVWQDLKIWLGILVMQICNKELFIFVVSEAPADQTSWSKDFDLAFVWIWSVYVSLWTWISGCESLAELWLAVSVRLNVRLYFKSGVACTPPVGGADTSLIKTPHLNSLCYYGKHAFLPSLNSINYITMFRPGCFVLWMGKFLPGRLVGLKWTGISCLSKIILSFSDVPAT